MFPAKRAKLFEFKTLWMRLLVLIRRIVPAAACHALKLYEFSHIWPLPGKRKLYPNISEITPAPTVWPPSRMAKRSSFSMAMGVMSSAETVTVSPGMTISTSLGS